MEEWRRKVMVRGHWVSGRVVQVCPGGVLSDDGAKDDAATNWDGQAFRMMRW